MRSKFFSCLSHNLRRSFLWPCPICAVSLRASEPSGPPTLDNSRTTRAGRPNPCGSKRRAESRSRKVNVAHEKLAASYARATAYGVNAKCTPGSCTVLFFRDTSSAECQICVVVLCGVVLCWALRLGRCALCALCVARCALC